MSILNPTADRVAVKRRNESTTAGGIVIPATAAEKPFIGEVVAVGPGKVLENGNVREVAVKVGDVVLFGKYAGTEIELKGQQLVVMREDDIMAVITEK